MELTLACVAGFPFSFAVHSECTLFRTLSYLDARLMDLDPFLVSGRGFVSIVMEGHPSPFTTGHPGNYNTSLGLILIIELRTYQCPTSAASRVKVTAIKVAFGQENRIRHHPKLGA